MLKINEQNRASGPSCGFPRMAEPLTPRTLEALQVFQPFSLAQKNFSPNGNWQSNWRIWGAHGWTNLAFKTMGMLSLERRQQTKTTFSLQITQKIIMEGGIVQKLQGLIQCNIDEIGSLREWELNSEISKTNGEPEPRLSMSYSGKFLDSGKWIQKFNGKATSVEQLSDAPFACDWALMEAVQRLPFLQLNTSKFHLLEGLTVQKPDFNLFFRDRPQDGLQKQNLPLHRFYLIGRGLLPTDYWVDDNHRLLMAINGSRVYLLDENAEELFEKSLKQQRLRKGYHGI